MKFIVFVTLLFFSWLSEAKASAEKTTIKLTITEWCPYVCDNSAIGKGIIYDYLSMILEPHNIELELEFMPWLQAITKVRSGDADGLIAAVHVEAPDLTFTNVETMHYRMCFYTRPEDTWQYRGEESLAERKLTVVSGYGYGEPIDDYIRKEQNKNKVNTLENDNSVEAQINSLTEGKADTFIEDAFVVRWQTRKLTELPFRNAGCLKPVPFYMAFNPEFARRTKIVETVNQVLSEPRNINYLNQFMLPHYFSPSSTNWDK